jgi:hypothetical protein
VERNKEVIYLPFWIAGMLERNALPLSDVLDYRKMSQFLSQQEQANLLLFQDFNPFILQTEDGRGIPTYGDIVRAGATDITEHMAYAPLAKVWRDNVKDSSDANDKRLLANLSTIDSISWAQTAKDEVKMRFDPSNNARVAHSHPFITYDVEREFVIVVVFPAYFEVASFATNTHELCKSVLKVLYVYNTYASGCKTPYFRKYLESLA